MAHSAKLNLLSKFYDYAAKHWGEQVEGCYDDDDNEVSGAVDTFIGKSDHVQLWGQMDYGEKLLARNSVQLESQINARVAWTQETPLMLASRYKHKGVVQWLASYPMLELNITRADGMTALTLAIEGGDDEIVAILRDRRLIY
ncbi:hypothetical protein BDN72DRAFT_866388 [Pluteus cervinus]|uniref:Uncharacterized protein n=1 Tax=Pluteus cervinus TaxID=181527 RepID=A0ACD2ZX28_9AGAR|nr:hypothetical protein BDN72DRAFT_866388 [Pluteus cervinus]